MRSALLTSILLATCAASAQSIFDNSQTRPATIQRVAAATRPAAAASPEVVLKSKGLTRVGAQYLLPGDAGLAESLRAVRGAKTRSDAGATKRAALEREIDRASDAALAATRESRDALVRLANIRKTDTRRYNEVVAQSRDADARRLEAAKLAESKYKELSRLADGHDDYVSLATSLAARMEAEERRYAALAADPAVTAALGALNAAAAAAGTPKLKLGPSAAFAQELPGARQARDVVASSAIKLTTNGGVPCALVMINDRASVMMVVDSGAAMMTLSADVAQELGLRPGKNTPVVPMTTADGKTVEARLMRLDSVRVGPFTVSDVQCLVQPSSVRGMNLLGGSFLKNFVCRVDLAAHELHLTAVGPEVSVATVTPRPPLPEVEPAPPTTAPTRPGPATAPPPPPPAPAAARGGTVSATFTKGKSSLEKLVSGAHSFGNRKYYFANVPPALSGLTFTRRAGGGGADDVTIDVPAGAAVYVLCDGEAAFHKHLLDTGWTRLDDLPVGGMEKNVPFPIYRKAPTTAPETIHLQHGGFRGLIIAAESLTVSP
jgi:clan AA aspartic protease (TIGR02281 family)